MAKLLKSAKEKIANFYFLGIAFLLFFIPVYPKFPLLAVKGTYVSIRLEDFFIAALVGIFFLIILIRRDFSLLKSFLAKLFILFFGIGLLSAFSAIFITKNVVWHIVLLHYLRRIEYITLFFVAYSSIKNTKQLKSLGWVIFFSAIGIIVYGLGQKFFGWPVVSTMNKEFSKGMTLKLTWWARINSTFAGHYDLAAYLVMLLSLATAALAASKKIIIKIIIFVLMLFSYYLLILTASRVSFFAYLVGVGLVLVLAKKWWFIVPFLALSLLGMVFSADLGQRYAATFKIDLSFMSGIVKMKASDKQLISQVITPSPASSSEEASSSGSVGGKIFRKPTPTLTPTPTPLLIEVTPVVELFEPTEMAVNRSTDIRLKVEWPRAIRAFLKNPLLGTGYSSITLATDNDYLRILGEVGILGALAFALIVLEIFRRLWLFVRSGKGKKEERLFVFGVLGASLGYFINACFIDVWEASKIAFFFWIMIGVTLKTIDLNDEK